MKLSQLRYFIAVCHCGNITQAARELNISQPSISNAIKELELEFGSKLFERVNGRLRITKNGEHLLMRAYKLIKDSDEIVELMKNSGVEKTKISVGVTPMISAFFLPEIYQGFLKKYPDTKIEVVELGALELQELLETEKIDCAVTIAAAIDTEDYNIRRLTGSEYCLCVGKKHPLAALEHVSYEDLSEVNLALLSGDSYHYEALMRHFKMHRITPNVVARSNQLQSIIRIVEIGAVCSFMLKEAEDVCDIKAISLEDAIPAEISVVWGKKSIICRRALQFIRFLMEKYRSPS